MAINRKPSETVSGILSLFPLYLTLVVNYPLLVGLLMNHLLVDARLLLINLIWLSAFMAAVQLFRSRALYRIAVVVTGIASVAESLHWLILKSPLSQSSLFVVAATNLQETVDFMNLKFGLNLLLLIPLLLVIYLGWRYKPEFRRFRFRGLVYGVVLGVFAVFIAENALGGRLARKGIPHFARVIFSFQQERRMLHQFRAEGKVQYVEAHASVKPLTVVLVIGESSNRNHWQLYGYSRQTTPRLSKRSDIYIFDNVVAAFSNTISSIIASLSVTSPGNPVTENGRYDIFDVFKSAGFTTYWISNQTPVGVWENAVTEFSRKSDHELFVNLAANSSMESMFTRSYDELLFSPVEKILKSDDPLKFLVVHTMGNHAAYKKRYPPEYERFRGDGKKERTIAEYDNSILYHDFFLDSLLKIVETNAPESVLLYASDHGENVYDENDEAGHTFSGRLPKANVEIPFFIWFSTDYSKTMDTEEVRNRRSYPYVTDNLFHTLTELGKIETPLLKPSASLFNPAFDTGRKRILEDGYDYDQ